MSPKTQTHMESHTTVESSLRARVCELKSAVESRKTEIANVETRIEARDQSHLTKREAITAKINAAKRALVDLRSADADTTSSEDAIRNLESTLQQLDSSYESDLTRTSDAELLDELRRIQAQSARKLENVDALADLVAAERSENLKNARSGIPEPRIFETHEDAEAYLANHTAVVLFVEVCGSITSGALVLPSGKKEHFSVTRGSPMKALVIPDRLRWIRICDLYSGIPIQSQFELSRPFLSARPANFRNLNAWGLRHACGDKETAVTPFVFIRSTDCVYVPDPKSIPRLRTELATETVNGVGYSRDVVVERSTVELIDRSDLLKETDCVIAHHIKETYDLNQPDAEIGPIGVRIRDAIGELTTDEPTFDLGQPRLTEAEIRGRIGPYWAAMIGAPWEGKISGTFALLKHLCKNKRESVSFWSKEIQGHYMFRVRTPDHNWIAGEVYCPLAASALASAPSDADVRVLTQAGENGHLITVGPCVMIIYPEPWSK